MKLAWYQKVNKHIWGSKALALTVLIANEALTWIIMICYGYGLIKVLVRKEFRHFAGLVLVPLVTFVIATWLRKEFRQKRPYMRAGIRPVVRKESDSYSFPSRHVTSAFVIGASLAGTSLAGPAVIVLFCALLLSEARVLGGVHYIRDVAAGAVLGTLMGLLIFIF